MNDDIFKSVPRRRRKMTTEVYAPWYLKYHNVLPSNETMVYQPMEEMDITNEKLKEAAMAPTDKTEELKKQLEEQKALKIQMVLTIISGDQEKMKENVKFIKPLTSPLKSMMEEEKRAKEAAAVRRKKKLLRQKLRKQRTVILKPKSKWRLFLDNRIIRMKFKALLEEKKSQRIRSKWRKTIRKVHAVLRFTNMIAILARLTSEVFKTFKQASDRGANIVQTGLCFDRLYYKATITKTTLDKETIYILTKPEHYRTWEEAHKAAINLRTLRSFAIMPRHFQDKIAMVGWYLEVAADKVIIREGHVPDSFYFIMSGRAAAVKLNGSPLYEKHAPFINVRTYGKDDIFGEDGLAGVSHRSYSVTAVDTCVLLSVNIHDYVRILNTSTSADENPDHIRILSQVDFMLHFPLSVLIQDSAEHIRLHYFTAGTVICKKSAISKFIYVIKSGTVKVMTEVYNLPKVVKKVACLNYYLPPISEHRLGDFTAPSRDRNQSSDRIPSLQSTKSLAKGRVGPSGASTSYNAGGRRLPGTQTKLSPIQNRFENRNKTCSTTKCPPISSSNEKRDLGVTNLKGVKNRFSNPTASTTSEKAGPVKDKLNGKEPAPQKRVIHFKSEGLPSIVTSLPLPRKRKELPPLSDYETGSNRPREDSSDNRPNDSTLSGPSELSSGKADSENSESELVSGKEGVTSRSASPFDEWLECNRNLSASQSPGAPEEDNYALSWVTGGSSEIAVSDDQDLAGSVSEEAMKTVRKMNFFMRKWRMSMARASLSSGRYSKDELSASTQDVLQQAGSVEKLLVPRKLIQKKPSRPEKIWVDIKTLGEGDVFGIEEVDLGDKHEHKSPDTALVSEGAEVIMIDKEFFLENCSATMKAHLRSCSYLLPDTEQILYQLQKKHFWNKWRDKTVAGIYNELGISR